MTAPRSDVAEEGMRYGLGFWLHARRSTVYLWGGDAGVSFGSAHDPESDSTYTAICNVDGGAAAVIKLVEELLA